MAKNRLFPFASNNPRDLLQEQFDALDSGWRVGRCQARNQALDSSVYELFDPEGSPYWLRFGPWREWGRVEDLTAHLGWIDQVLRHASELFRMMGSIFPPVRWSGMEAGYIGITRRLPSLPFKEAFSEDDPPRFENLVQLTGFLRLLQTAPKQLVLQAGGEQTKDICQQAQDLADRAVDLIPRQQIFQNWRAFYFRNAKTIASSPHHPLTLSLGPYAPTCITWSPKGSLLINEPFFLGAAIADTDLCRLLYEWEELGRQDRQYLVDLYYNLEPPSYFFTLMAYQHMTMILQELTESEESPCERQRLLERFARLARSYDLFRTPVPAWYA